MHLYFKNSLREGSRTTRYQGGYTPKPPVSGSTISSNSPRAQKKDPAQIDLTLLGSADMYLRFATDIHMVCPIVDARLDDRLPVETIRPNTVHYHLGTGCHLIERLLIVDISYNHRGVLQVLTYSQSTCLNYIASTFHYCLTYTYLTATISGSNFRPLTLEKLRIVKKTLKLNIRQVDYS